MIYFDVNFLHVCFRVLRGTLGVIRRRWVYRWVWRRICWASSLMALGLPGRLLGRRWVPGGGTYKLVRGL